MIKRLIGPILAAAALCASDARAANQASFDCARAGTKIEKVLCADAKLAALDLQLGKAFAALVTANPGHAGDLRRDQRAWLSYRDETCRGAATAGCLSEIYPRQIAWLSGKDFLVCGAPRQQPGAISLTCDALNSSAHLSLTLAGREIDRGRVTLDSLTVRRAGAPSQSLKLEDADIFKGGLRNTPLDKVMELVDVNFDRQADIKLWTSTSAGPNNGYSYWLFDAKANKFQSSDLGDKLSGLDVSIDPASRTIKTSGRSSCCDWETQVYRWVGSRLRIMTIETGRIYKYRLPPLAKRESVELCATQTDHYNEREELVRNDIGPCEMNPEQGDMKRGAFVALLRKNLKGYQMTEKDKDHLTITYDKPLPGYAEP